MAISSAAQPDQRVSLVGGLLGNALSILFWFVMAFMFSIIVEWIGMTWYWPEMGSYHARLMLETELSYVHQDFQQSLVTSDTANFVFASADLLYWLIFESTGLDSLLAQINYGGEYINAAILTTQVFAARVAVLTLATPGIALLCTVGASCGIAHRYIRRCSGGRELGLYDHVKRYIPLSLIAPWVIYLSLPFSLHPAWVVLTFGFISATATGITIAMFRKYW